jgi:hypothetical protein
MLHVVVGGEPRVRVSLFMVPRSFGTAGLFYGAETARCPSKHKNHTDTYYNVVARTCLP